ncbi:NAD(P)-dependent oxidoreductase [Variovorax paradoxus]|nr:NAD-dependent epimerase/dehydratase family protein [Variovorax paradoxus]MBT2298864.1 NAD(P)-dependent oxidoreductase [Variovorax paradoxus]
MIYVIGGRGRLGRAIAGSYPACDVEILERSVYEDWWQSGSDSRIRRYFEGAPPGSSVAVTAGVLDPAAPEAEHRRVNVELPANIIAGACAARLRVLTFGTVMERLIAHPNAYVASKAELGRIVAERAAAGDPVVHAQVHTLYGGGTPSPHMFVGQIAHALRQKVPFEMSPGRQLREYHHVDDEVAAVHALLETGLAGVVTLSHGAPCTLRDLAAHVFAAFGRQELLRIGARPEPPDDNYATVLQHPTWLAHVDFRPALPGVATYLQELLSDVQQQA